LIRTNNILIIQTNLELNSAYLNHVLKIYERRYQDILKNPKFREFIHVIASNIFHMFRHIESILKTVYFIPVYSEYYSNCMWNDCTFSAMTNARRTLKLRGRDVIQVMRSFFFTSVERKKESEKDLSKKIKTKPVRRLVEQESERGKEEKRSEGWSRFHEHNCALGANTHGPRSTKFTRCAHFLHAAVTWIFYLIKRLSRTTVFCTGTDWIVSRIVFIFFILPNVTFFPTIRSISVCHL